MIITIGPRTTDASSDDVAFKGERMAEGTTGDAALSGGEQERTSAVLTMVHAALARLNADRKAQQPGVADWKIADLERERGLPKGALASPLKPVNLGRVPRQPTIRTLAAALNLDAAQLGQAFMTDYIGDGDEKTVNQQRAADLIGELAAPLQRLAIRQLEALVDYHRACERACEAVTLTPNTDGSAT